MIITVLFLFFYFTVDQDSKFIISISYRKECVKKLYLLNSDKNYTNIYIIKLIDIEILFFFSYLKSRCNSIRLSGKSSDKLTKKLSKSIESWSRICYCSYNVYIIAKL